MNSQAKTLWETPILVRKIIFVFEIILKNSKKIRKIPRKSPNLFGFLSERGKKARIPN